MPNPVPAKYTVQLGPTVTPEVGGELAAWAEVLGDSMSVIARECIDAGLEALRPKFAERARSHQVVASPVDGSPLFLPPPTVLAARVEQARMRGNKQVARRRAYDERTRQTGAPAEPERKPRKGGGRKRASNADAA